MKYAIELYYDEQIEQGLNDLAAAVAQAGISMKFLQWRTRPHLTLACYNDVDAELCAQRLRAFAQSHPSLPAYIGSVGMFSDTRTIFASPIMTSAMYRFQRELHEALSDFDSRGWEWYCPDRWVPHTTLALTAEDEDEAFFRASDLVLRRFKKLSGEFVAIGLVKIALPVEELFTVKLCK